MTQEDKELLLKDLCARLPYGVIFKDECDENLHKIYYIRDEDIYTRTYPNLPSWIETIKPYLRPMSSMTEEEFDEYETANEMDTAESSKAIRKNLNGEKYISSWYHGVDWLNAHHFDFRGLIPRGLAIEAPDGIYN